MKIVKKTINVFLCVVGMALLLMQVAFARWETKEDAASQYNFYYENIKINKNGTSENTLEFERELLKEADRGELSVFQLSYNGASEKITIIAENYPKFLGGI